MALDMFRGEYVSRMDAKARVSIPAAFRKEIEKNTGSETQGRTRVVLVYGDPRRKFVAGYSLAGAERLAAQIRELPDGSGARKTMQRHMIVKSVPLDIDDDGRIVMPQAVREKLGLIGETGVVDVMFAGALDYFELWHKATYDAEAAALDAVDDGLLGEGEDILSLLGRFRARD
jgi:MraZ protein